MLFPKIRILFKVYVSSDEMRILAFQAVLERILDVDVGLDAGVLQVGTVEDAVAAPGRHAAGGTVQQADGRGEDDPAGCRPGR